MEGNKVDLTNIQKLAVGTIIKVTGLDLALLKFIRTVKPADDAPERADGEPARDSHRFSYGRLAFSVDSQLAEQAELMMSAEKRKDIGMLILEIGERKVSIPDADGNPTDEYEMRKTLQFVNVINKVDAKALVQSGGELAKAEEQYAPKAALDVNTLLDTFDAWQARKEKKALAPA